MVFVTLNCPQCGGRLDEKGDHYICPFCNNEIVRMPTENLSFSTDKKEQSGRRVSVRVKYGDVVKRISFCNDVTIICDNRKRATMADKKPMSLSIVRDGCRMLLIDSFDNVGKGQIKITDGDDGFLVTVEGDVDVRIDGVCCCDCAVLSSTGELAIGSASFLFTSDVESE